MRGTASTTSTKIDGCNTPEDIADKFKDIYNGLYNRTGTSEPMEDLLREVNEKINGQHLEDVDSLLLD